MGLPRYLKDKYKKGDFDKEWLLVNAIENIYGTNKALNITKENLNFYKNSLLIYGLKKEYGLKNSPYLLRAEPFGSMCKNVYDYQEVYKHQFSKHEVFFFTKWLKDKGKWKAYGKYLSVNYYFFEKAYDISEIREQKAKDEIDRKEELDRMRKVKQGRVFTGRLRYLILQRDNFKCVKCGRGVQEGAILEVDHIKEWEDGGITSYDNGQTVCSDCNKGKYHIKRYNDLNVVDAEIASGE